MKILSILILLLITGCSTMKQSTLADCPATEIAIQTKIEKLKIPEQFLYIPPNPQDINTSNMTQREAAIFIVNTEERMRILENNLRAIKELNDKVLEELSTPPEP